MFLDFYKMNENSFLDDFNEFDVSGEFLKEDKKKSISNQKSSGSLDIPCIENKEIISHDDDREDLIQFGILNSEMNKGKIFKNKLNINMNTNKIKKHNISIENKYLNNPENMLMNNIIMEKEGKQQNNTNSELAELTKEFIKNHKNKKFNRDQNKKRSKTADNALQKDFKDRWKWKKDIKNWPLTLRNYDKNLSR